MIANGSFPSFKRIYGDASNALQYEEERHRRNGATNKQVGSSLGKNTGHTTR